MLDEIMFRSDPGAFEKLQALLGENDWSKADTQFTINYMFSAVADFLVDGDEEVIEATCGSLGSFTKAHDKVCEWCYANGIDPLPFYEACLHVEWHIYDTEERPSLCQVDRMLQRAAWVARRLDPLFVMPKATKEVELTRVLSVEEAARYFNGDSAVTNATTFLKGKYDARVLSKPIGSGQNRRWIANEFPASVRNKIR